VRSGHIAADAERLSRLLRERHGESNRDGCGTFSRACRCSTAFSSKAPARTHRRPAARALLPVDAAKRNCDAAGVSGKLVGLFAPTSMTVASGLTDVDPHAASAPTSATSRTIG
jgi:hypothetical protein